MNRPTSKPCEDCSDVFPVGQFGRVPATCPPCRAERKRKSDSAYQRSNQADHNEANRRWRARNKRPSPVVTIVCVDCGGQFSKVHSAGRLSVRCPDCRTANRLARIRVQTAARRKTNASYFAAYRRRNSARETARALQWAKDNPERHRGRGARYRSRRFSAVVEVFTREEIAERDGWMCAECSSPVDPQARFPDPMAGELDHVIPVTHPDYPGHTRENAALVHSRCNKAKGGWRAG